MRTPLYAMLLASTLCAGCAEDDDGGAADAAPSTPDAHVPEGEDLDMKASDFECLLRWDKVRNFRVTNKLGKRAETLAVAENAAGGGEYPVGTVIQIVPIEAMVKRARGWNPATNDWEYFNLEVSATGTVIAERGADIGNLAGSCNGCHQKAMPQYDLICENGHGCDPLPFGTDVLLGLQNDDPRCP